MNRMIFMLILHICLSCCAMETIFEPGPRSKPDKHDPQFQNWLKKKINELEELRTKETMKKLRIEQKIICGYADTITKESVTEQTPLLLP